MMRSAFALLSGLSGILLPAAAIGAPASLTITQDMPLRFGTLVVFGGGSRTIRANGDSSNDGVYPVGLGGGGPAQFTVTYDRGDEPLREISVTFMFMLSSVAPMSQSGLSGSLGNFDSDLAGSTMLAPGRAVIQTMPMCITRICTTTFRIGARLDMTRASGSGPLVFALPVSAKLVAVQSL
jgi:Domain of unknown function (DUF4402)